MRGMRVINTSPNIRNTSELREKISADVEAFLAGGGVIQEIGTQVKDPLTVTEAHKAKQAQWGFGEEFKAGQR